MAPDPDPGPLRAPVRRAPGCRRDHHRGRLRSGVAALAVAALVPTIALPQGQAPAAVADRGVSYTYFGTPGLLEMPSAISANDGEIAGTVGVFGGQTRTSFTVQVTPRFSGTFRYSNVDDFAADGEAFYDRSFDLRYRFTDEGRVMPQIAVGLQDFLGTGLYSAEYVVATKTLGDSVRVTAGLGWGRLGTQGGFTNPLGVLDDRFETRPDTFDEGGDEGGTPGVEAFFRGDAAVFGGVEWAVTDRLTVKAEYSSDDAYVDVNGEPLFDVNSPVNVGLAWRPLPGVQLSAGYLYGSQLSFGATVTVNPNQRPIGSLDLPPVPVAERAADVRASGTWDRTQRPEAAIRTSLEAALASEGIRLVALQLTDRTARVRYVNERYRTEAQALGRVSRVLTRELPPSIETLVLEAERVGIPLSAVTFARSDIEAFENEVGGTAASLERAGFDDAGTAAGLEPLPAVDGAFGWGARPYLSFSFFGDDPLEVTFGAEVSADYRIRPNLVLSGTVRQRLYPFGERDVEAVIENDEVPVVRRNGRQYGRDGYPVIQDLTLARYGRPGPDLYSRVTLGYLERQYGGLSGEVLWKPVESALGLGLEVNYVRQRGFDQLLDFRDYDVVTGHASAYYDFRNGFHGQIDAGRYLAGDLGATVRLDREFDNGWRVGGFFSLTDIPFEDYGEGSFDKGISISVPFDFILGRPTRRGFDYALSSLNRDGGERVRVEGRLYDVVRDAHYGDLEDSWGRFWR